MNNFVAVFGTPTPVPADKGKTFTCSHMEKKDCEEGKADV